VVEAPQEHFAARTTFLSSFKTQNVALRTHPSDRNFATSLSPVKNRIKF
jgi:hypothetical protein